MWGNGPCLRLPRGLGSFLAAHKKCHLSSPDRAFLTINGGGEVKKKSSPPLLLRIIVILDGDTNTLLHACILFLIELLFCP